MNKIVELKIEETKSVVGGVKTDFRLRRAFRASVRS
jgi:hypothetical protein